MERRCAVVRGARGRCVSREPARPPLLDVGPVLVVMWGMSEGREGFGTALSGAVGFWP